VAHSSVASQDLVEDGVYVVEITLPQRSLVSDITMSACSTLKVYAVEGCEVIEVTSYLVLAQTSPTPNLPTPKKSDPPTPDPPRDSLSKHKLTQQDRNEEEGEEETESESQWRDFCVTRQEGDDEPKHGFIPVTTQVFSHSNSLKNQL